jgi:hypothetical protein
MLFSTWSSEQPAMDIVTGELLQLSRRNFQFLSLIYYYISSVQKHGIFIIMVIRLSVLTVNAVIAEKRLYIADERHISAYPKSSTLIRGAIFSSLKQASNIIS